MSKLKLKCASYGAIMVPFNEIKFVTFLIQKKKSL